MPANYEMEALRAQAVVARTYTLYQIINSNGKHGDSDICDNYACCQAWISKENRMDKWSEDEKENNWEKISLAVNSTKGQIITYEGNPIDAFFHSNSGGITETANNVWGGTNMPYLQSVETSGESEYSQYNSEVEINIEDLGKKIKERYPEFKINYEDENCIQIKEHTESGRVKTMIFGNVEIPGTQVRTIFGLKSTNFTFEICNGKVKFIVIGYGHGVGMSQTGADAMAKIGANYEEIIKHYYTGVEIETVNELI